MARATIPQISHFPLDDRDLDDADLWAVIDSAAASNSSLRSRNPLLSITNSSTNSLVPIPSPTFASPGPPKYKRIGEVRDYRDGEVVEEDAHWIPHKMGRFVENSSPSDGKNVVVIRQQHQQQRSPRISFPVESPEVGSPSPHSLAGHFPSVALFKQYQNAAIAILEKSDYTMISGNPFIKKSGWRKISFYFNLSFEIKDKSIEYDENRNVVRAEFVVRAYMQSRFSDGWGSCERREKRFLRPNHDVPSTAETRAKNKACQDLLGVGQYQPGASGRSR